MRNDFEAGAFGLQKKRTQALIDGSRPTLRDRSVGLVTTLDLTLPLKAEGFPHQAEPCAR
jgi:hypothetical protein